MRSCTLCNPALAGLLQSTVQSNAVLGLIPTNAEYMLVRILNLSLCRRGGNELSTLDSGPILCWINADTMMLSIGPASHVLNSLPPCRHV
jgi:hypothetical protein